MKKFFKYFVYFLGVALLLILGAIVYLKFFLPNTGPAPDLKVDMSTENIERGKYLANHVSVCIDCHSTRDWSTFSGPLVVGTEGKGGGIFNQQLGFPGTYFAPNLTPYHLIDWTDGEIFRAITTGVSKDGRALFNVMPYLHFGKMDKKDIEAIIAYIRTLKPIENNVSSSSSDFPMNFLINTLPEKAQFTTMPAKSDELNYGSYVINAAGCAECHTKREKGKPVGKPFAGGFEFKLPDGSVLTSANITPDKATGIGTWTKEEFIQKFKMYTDSSYVNHKVNRGELQTLMPWTMYSGMKTEDLEAIFTYLQSVASVNNKIEKFKPAK